MAEKMKMHSPDLVAENVARIAELFPGCVTEAKGDDGQVKRAIDFDLLRQELSDHIVEGPRERYHLDWPGKKEALLVANSPIAKTLRPCRGESVDFENTKNLFIEGDNLEALKLLQETYLNKVKLIYIDPPYNTGNDFVYCDKFVSDRSKYLLSSQEVDEVGNRLVLNSDSSGRFHSDWLSMMYPRLKLARNLLSEDGVIFISIDVNEFTNVKKLCDELFGESCHKNTISVRRGIKNVQAQFEDLNALSQGHEYILLYSKQNYMRLPKAVLNHAERKPGKWDTFWRGTDRPTMRYELLGTSPTSGQWRWEQSRALEAVRNYEQYLTHHEKHLSLDDWYLDNLTSTNTKLNFVRLSGDGVVQYYVPPSEGKLLSDNWMDLTLSGSATKEFDTEKSADLLIRIISWIVAPEKDSIVLDFFAGSSTTAHAVIAQNSLDNGQRRFIMVQVGEPCDEKTEAFKSGFQTVADISKERIRRSGSQVKSENSSVTSNLDAGFRVLKIDSSNMKDVYYAPDQIKQADMFDQIENIKEDRTPEDLLFQVLLDWGVDLSLPIEQVTMDGKTVFCVDGNALAACFDTGINEELVKLIADRKPLRVVFRDSGYANDAARINVEQIFKALSPQTEVRSL